MRTLKIYLLLVFLHVTADGHAQEGRYDIHKIQAAFIYNFMDFVRWPVQSNSSGKLMIGILGDDPFDNAFAEVEDTKVFGKSLSIRKSDRLEELLDSWILFISSSEAMRVDQILNALEYRPILTVSDMDDFTRSGGMIQFYSAEINGEVKVRFDINKDRVDQAGLTISFQLLSLARPKK